MDQILVKIQSLIKNLSGLKNVFFDLKFIKDQNHPIVNIMKEILKISKEHLIDQFTGLNLDAKFQVFFEQFKIGMELFATSVKERNDPFY